MSACVGLHAHIHPHPTFHVEAKLALCLQNSITVSSFHLISFFRKSLCGTNDGRETGQTQRTQERGAGRSALMTPKAHTAIHAQTGPDNQQEETGAPNGPHASFAVAFPGGRKGRLIFGNE